MSESSVSAEHPPRAAGHQLPSPARDGAPPLLTAIVTIDPGVGVSGELLRDYRTALDATGAPYEVLCVVSAAAAKDVAALATVARDWSALTVVAIRPWHGEDDAFGAAVRRARGGLVLSLPSWRELDAAGIGVLVAGLGDADMATARRTRRAAGWLERRRRAFLHGLIRVLFGHAFEDVFSRARLGRREVFEAISGFGVRQHFLPLLAVSRGFAVREVDVGVPPEVRRGETGSFKPLAHVSALFDVIALYVALKFLRRPLRFFGAIGLPVFLIGAVVTGVLIVERLFFGQPLADRPVLIFSTMAAVLGIQIIALGLIGEIIIFSSSRRMKAYEIDRIIKADRRD